MSFPSGADYMEALQHPASCFALDPELASGTPELSPLGLPRPVSGNFASVFRVSCENGKTYAVRCFTRWFDDQERRYQAISGGLGLPRSASAGSWQVGFEYLPQGINVNGEWYPILKMPWVESRPLLGYVEEHLWDAASMAYLAVRFAELVASLRSVGIAHGDLQHGNILVAPGGDLRLIDYDGMYVPALKGLESNELGHRNYQHPRRKRCEFGPNLDHFSSWVIYTSLVALSIDPVLWGRVDGGDECLLFRHRDFVEPAQSEVLLGLDDSDDLRLRRLGGILRRMLNADNAIVPPLDLRLAPPPAHAVFEQVTAASLAQLAERQSLFAVLRGEAHSPRSEAPGRSEGTDDIGLEPPKAVVPKEFGAAVNQHRLRLAGAAAAVAALLVCGVAGVVPLVVGVLLAVAIGACSGWLAQHTFHAMPEVRAIRPKQLELAELTKTAAAARATLDSIARRRQDADRIEEEAARRSADAEGVLRHEEQAALGALDIELRSTLSDISSREHELYRAEQHERADALRSLQHAALEAELRKVPLASARLPHVNDSLIYALALDDVRYAADFVDVVVDESRTRSRNEEVILVLADGRNLRLASLGAEQARQLIQWRRTLESKFAFAKPEVLPADREETLRASYVAKREGLEDEQARVRAAAHGKAEEIRAGLRKRHALIVEEGQAAQHGAAGTRLKLDQELAKATKDAAEAEWRRAACERELDSYAGLTFAAFLRAVATFR